MKKYTIPVRMNIDVHSKLVDKSLRLSAIEGKRIPISEITRRILNIPNLDKILIEDAKVKRCKNGIY